MRTLSSNGSPRPGRSTSRRPAPDGSSLSSSFHGSPVASVYVHAPFCPRRCWYCDFAVAVPGKDEDMAGPWIRALAGELDRVRREERVPLAPALRTLFVGGGTPSLLGPGAMGALARLLGSERLGDPELEWTAEANPESFTPELARAWAASGVNRVSLGAQSFQEEALRWMGRIHEPGAPARAVEAARRAGIRNLSLDLMFGFPPDLERDWVRDLEEALALEAPHLSLYGLTVEEETPLGRAVATGRARAPEEDRYREEYLQAAEILVRAGYRHYEVSNFARPGFQARHNRAYWEGRPYLGLGNSAHSFLPPLRRWNLRDWNAYQNSVREGSSPVAGEEMVTGGARRLEALWLALRTDAGLSLASLSPPARALPESWQRRGLAEVDGPVVRLTARGWLLLDHLVVELDGALG